MTTGTCTKSLVKFGRTVFELCEWTDKQTYSLQYFATTMKTVMLKLAN